MMIELEPSFLNRTRRRNDKSARGHETAHCHTMHVNTRLQSTLTQCPRMDLSKRFLPKPITTTG